jgi:hypothetical protein
MLAEDLTSLWKAVGWVGSPNALCRTLPPGTESLTDIVGEVSTLPPALRAPFISTVFMLVEALQHASNPRHSLSEGLARENGILHRNDMRREALRGAGSSIWCNTLFQAPLLTDNQFGFPITIQSTVSVAP